MLTHDELMDYYRELREKQVLSVYLDTDQHDPARRNVWKTTLGHQLDAIRDDLSNDERDAFEEAVKRVRERLDDFNAFVPNRGFVAFATPDQVRYAEAVPVPMPDLARWEPGVRTAPYVRALGQERPVVLVLLDARHSRVFRRRNGALDEVDGFHAETFLGDLSDIHTGKRPTTRSGVRGQTSTDAAQRFLEVNSDRMVKSLMDAVVRYVGDHGFLVIGGTPERVSRAANAVPKGIGSRVREEPSLHVDMSTSEVRGALEVISGEMTREYQRELLTSLVEQARSRGRACLGREDIDRALRDMRVDTLLISRAVVEREPDYADDVVGTAFAGSAHVEEVQAPVSELLDREGEGLAARLRFRRTDGGAA